jgi:phage tail-like protein
MAPSQRNDPYRNFRFLVEIEGVAHAGFSDVEIGAWSVEVVEYREGSEPAATRKLPGLHKFGDVTLKRGMTASLELFQWFQQVVSGDPNFRRSLAIIILGDDGNPVARFQVQRAWPRKLAVGDLHAKGNEVLIEAIELVNEGVERVQ